MQLCQIIGFALKVQSVTISATYWCNSSMCRLLTKCCPAWSAWAMPACRNIILYIFSCFSLVIFPYKTKLVAPWTPVISSVSASDCLCSYCRCFFSVFTTSLKGLTRISLFGHGTPHCLVFPHIFVSVISFFLPAVISAVSFRHPAMIWSWKSLHI